MRNRIAALLFAPLFGLALYYLYPEAKLEDDIAVNRLVVYKSQRTLLAYADAELVKIYSISLGRSPEGDKEYEGDNRTPEGVYTINDKNAYSAYHKNLGISYPNATDIAHARKLGKSPGGAIKIHGLRNGIGAIGKLHRWANWTQGCIAVTDEEIDELYRAVAIGTPIEIHP